MSILAAAPDLVSGVWITIDNDHGLLMDVALGKRPGDRDSDFPDARRHTFGQPPRLDLPDLYVCQFDVFDDEQRVLLSGTIAGARDPELEAELLEHAGHWGGVELVTHPFGTIREHECCKPKRYSSPEPRIGSRQWFSAHGRAVNGPGGWSSQQRNWRRKLVSETRLAHGPYSPLFSWTTGTPRPEPIVESFPAKGK